MKRISFFILAAFLSTTAMAQKVTIKGVLKDSLLNETEPYATVKVYEAGNLNKPVAMSVTDADGNINQTVNGNGKYIISFYSVGKSEVRRNIDLNGENGNLNLGTVFTKEDPRALNDVEIVAQKPIVKMETDKMTYNVQEDVDSKSMTVLDMLRKVPMVVVDGQDNITVGGSSSFKVYVNGKPNQMFNNNASQIFKAMPAAMVKNIEVITNPGAKYDAEGTSCILNIIMDQIGGQSGQSMNGYNGSIRAGISNNSKEGGFSINGQQGKLSYSASGTYNYQKMDGSDIIMLRDNYDNEGNVSSMKYHQTSTFRQPFAMGNVSIGYDVDTLSTLNVNFGVNYFNQKIKGTPFTEYKGGIYGDGYSYPDNMNMRYKDIGYNGSIDYQRYLNGARTRSITFTYQFDSTPVENNMSRYFGDVTGTPLVPLQDMASKDKTGSVTHTGQIDFSTPLADKHIFNVGVKYINRHNSSNSDYYNITDGEYIYSEASSMKYRNNQAILAGYAEYKGSWFEKLNTTVGMRYEHTWQSIKYLLDAKNNFKNNYGNLVPSLSVGYNFTQMMNLGINYSINIRRPGISYMNPYVDNMEVTTKRYGNPNLDVEKSHKFGLVFNYFSQKFMMNATLGQTICNNQISEYSFMDSENKLNTTYGNVVKNRWTNINSFLRYTFSKSTTVMTNISLDYGDMRSDELKQKNHGWQFSCYAGLEQVLPLQIKWSLGSYAKTKDYNLQGWNGGMSIFQTSFSKSLFKDKLDLSLLYVVPYTGKFKLRQYSAGSDYENHFNININIQTIRLTATWHFGNTKKQFQKHQSKINNDFNDKSNGQGVPSGVGI